MIVELDIKEVILPIAEGVTYAFWTFGGRVPGKFIRVRQGDTVEFHLMNNPDNRFPHNIDLEPPSGLPQVDREFYIIQGDFYTAGTYHAQGIRLSIEIRRPMNIRPMSSSTELKEQCLAVKPYAPRSENVSGYLSATAVRTSSPVFM